MRNNLIFNSILSASPPIILDLSVNGTFTMSLAGLGNTFIDWGDGISENVNLNTVTATDVSHSYTSAKTAKIANSALITTVSMSHQDVKNIQIPKEAVNIETIGSTWTLLSSLQTHKEWTKLKNLYIYNQTPGVTSLDLYPEWTQLQILMTFGNDISILNNYEWPNLTTYSCYQGVPVLNCSTYEWPNLTFLGAGPGLTTFEPKTTWTKLGYFGLSLSGNAFPQSVVDNILTTINSIDYSTGILSISGGTNAMPSRTGLEADVSLRSRNVSVAVNEANDILTSWTMVTNASCDIFTTNANNITRMYKDSYSGTDDGRVNSNYMDVSAGDMIRIYMSLNVDSSVGPRLRSFDPSSYYEPFGLNNLVDGTNVTNFIINRDTSRFYFELSNVNYPNEPNYVDLDFAGTLYMRKLS